MVVEVNKLQVLQLIERLTTLLPNSKQVFPTISGISSRILATLIVKAKKLHYSRNCYVITLDQKANSSRSLWHDPIVSPACHFLAMCRDIETINY